jgi:hypothetical protein
MGLKEPKIALPTLLSKIKRKTAKAEKTGDWMQLCVEMTDLPGQKKDIVGSTCEIKGITPQWLEQGTLAITNSISNHIIAELSQYRRIRSIKWKTFHFLHRYLCILDTNQWLLNQNFITCTCSNIIYICKLMKAILFSIATMYVNTVIQLNYADIDKYFSKHYICAYLMRLPNGLFLMKLMCI